MRDILARTVLLLVCVGALVGCGLRPETSDAVTPSPGPAEQARARTVADAAALVDAASALAPTADDTMSPVLADIAAFSTAHIDALGGVYDSGLPTGSSTTSSPPPTPNPSALLDQLAAATATAATDTDRVDDSDLARVLGSVATARGDLTARFATALGAVAPSTTPASPDSDPSDPDPSDPDPSASGSPGPEQAGSVPARVAGLALAHDQAGYAYEVVAAQAPADSDLRGVAQAAAEGHRTQAGVWARTGGVDGTTQDPRRPQYGLPDNLADPETARTLVVRLEQAVGQAASAALAEAAPGSRADLLMDLGTATAAATAWGADPEPLPGLPSAAAPTPSPTPSPTP